MLFALLCAVVAAAAAAADSGGTTGVLPVTAVTAADAAAAAAATFPCGRGGPHTPIRRFAYVLMHYEGTPKDAEYVLGTRVLVQSLLASGTQEDIVILASKTVSQRTIDQFCSDGVIVEVRRHACTLSVAVIHCVLGARVVAPSSPPLSCVSAATAADHGGHPQPVRARGEAAVPPHTEQAAPVAHDAL
jgi:hypothetical protein